MQKVKYSDPSNKEGTTRIRTTYQTQLKNIFRNDDGVEPFPLDLPLENLYDPPFPAKTSIYIRIHMIGSYTVHG